MRDRSLSKKREEFLQNSFLARLTGPIDDVCVCGHIKNLLVRIFEVFCINDVGRDSFRLLENAIRSTEKSFDGECSNDLFEMYYTLGVILIDLGEEELGIACHYLHHVYKNRPRSSWPPIKARDKQRGSEVISLLPIVKAQFNSDVWEKDTDPQLKKLA